MKILYVNKLTIKILTDKSDGGNYSLENEKEIIEIFVKNNFIIHMFNHVDNNNEDENLIHSIFLV